MTATTLESAAYIVSPVQVALDTAMLSYDIWGTQAHVLMLEATGIVPTSSAAAIGAALRNLDAQVAAGTFTIDPARGAQLSLEQAVLAAAGVADGSRMHTARSRNDQVMVTELLYLRERALALAGETARLIDALLRLAAEHVDTVMPGYTHMQPAKPTSFGQWALAYADALLRGLDDLEATWAAYDACPLGAVESYGTAWPIDRALTARLLGFARVWEVPQDAIGARGLPQLAYLDVCKRLALTISKIAADLLLFTTWEYSYVHLGAAVAQRLHPITGSSVMAQKKNPDALELLRATGHEVIGLAGTAAHVLAGLPMGYNRDTREIKEWSALGFDKTLAALGIMRVTLSTLAVDRERMAGAVRENYSSTTDLADMIAARNGVGYRQVYAVVGRLVDGLIEAGRPLGALSAAEIVATAEAAGLTIHLSDEEVGAALDPREALSWRKHIGGSAPAEMARLLADRQVALAAHLGWIDRRSGGIAAARAETLDRMSVLVT
ncbi:MAG TPA: argininosuccinate lyase [Chloroflexia bacterium]|nr:argininosuccinate lyase [Chloroflexia bacterium]